MMRHALRLALVLFAALSLAVGAATPIGAGPSSKSRSAMTTVPTGAEVGWSQLHKSDEGLRATVHTSGLTPGGAYTIWWVAIGHEGPEFAALFDGWVAHKNGKHTAHGSAPLGMSGIDIAPLIPAPGPINVGEVNARVINDLQIEFHLLYHGQASAAPNGAELALWLSNFWSGDPAVCNHTERFPFGDRDVCALEQLSVH